MSGERAGRKDIKYSKLYPLWYIGCKKGRNPALHKESLAKETEIIFWLGKYAIYKGYGKVVIKHRDFEDWMRYNGYGKIQHIIAERNQICNYYLHTYGESSIDFIIMVRN